MVQGKKNTTDFRVEIISATLRPYIACVAAMRQDYSGVPVYDQLKDIVKYPDKRLGKMLIRKILKAGHYGVMEHPQLVLNVINFPHSVIAQFRTHRHLSFDCQSQRYTGNRIVALAEALKNAGGGFNRNQELIEELFYFRPSGRYVDRRGNKYEYTEEARNKDIIATRNSIQLYANHMQNDGFAPEHARDILTQNIRQHFVMSGNARSFMHLFNLRSTRDVQLEARQACHLIFQRFKEWMPEVGAWYEETHYGKNNLSA